jgi:hypothetical protein
VPVAFGGIEATMSERVPGPSNCSPKTYFEL